MWNLEYPFERIRSVLPAAVRIENGSDKIVSYWFPGDEDGEILPFFEILFLLAFDSERYPHDTRLMSRAIRCRDKECANHIAHHMLGEEIYPGKVLDVVLKIIRFDPSVGFAVEE